MTTKKYPYKITKGYEYAWVAHPEGGDNDDRSKLLIENRHNLEIVGEVEDNDASYSYDSWALVRLKGKYYLLSTAGCSCPSPTETWHIQHGPSTLAQIKKHVTSGDYSGYTVPGRQLKDFLDMIEAEKQRREKKDSDNE